MFKRLFSQGFRIFFLAACLFSLVSMAIWEGFLWLQAFADGVTRSGQLAAITQRAGLRGMARD